MKNSLKLNIISFLSEISIVTLAVYLPYRAFQLGADNITAGLVGGASSIVYMFMPFTMGRLSDRFGAKTIFLIGSLMLFFVSLSYFLLASLEIIVIMRVIEGVGWAMIWPPLESMVSYEEANPYTGLARFNISWGLGAALAPSLGALIEHGLSIRYTLLFASMCMFIVFTITQTLGKETNRINNQHNVEKNSIHLALTSLYFTSMYGVAINVITTFFPRYASLNSLNTEEWGTIISSLLFARLLAFILAEIIRQRIGVKNVFAPFSFTSLIFPVMALVNGSNFAFLIISSTITGFSIGLVYSAALNKTMIENLGGRGSAAGMFESSIGMGSFFGPLIAGTIASKELWAFLFVPIITMLLGGLLGITRRESLSINTS